VNGDDPFKTTSNSCGEVSDPEIILVPGPGLTE
jgi:hypothetical protein